GQNSRKGPHRIERFRHAATLCRGEPGRELVRAIESIYSPAVAAAFLRSSNPQLDDEAPLVVLATQPVDEAEQAMLAAARAFLEG
ncbi:MAG: hypothetical protein QOE52_2642, partial [Mycobacterium sp.]|nr:hypothetical protein [Mycobacterium sp.]